MNWDQKFLRLALEIASWSKDKSTKVGAVIVGPDHEILSTGYNGMCRGANDNRPERHERPEKYIWMEHAERNAVFNAARIGVSLKGSTLYCNSTESLYTFGMSCVDCTRAIIQSGIKRLVQPPMGKEFINLAEQMGGWRATCMTAMDMLAECGVQLDFVSL